MKETNAISIGGMKIIIGNHACREVGTEVMARHCHKAFLVSDRGVVACGLIDEAITSMKEKEVDYVLFDEVPSDPPSSIVDRGSKLMKLENCDCVVAIGGGSVMDAAKAINMMAANPGSILEYDNSPSGGKKFLNEGKPLFSIPTTSGTGSEVTQYAVITSEKEQRKATIGDERMTSKVVFLSPFMTVGLPAEITAATGIDALAHGIEAYTSNRVLTAAGSSVFSDTLALQAIHYVSQNLRQAYCCGNQLEARKNVMLGSTLAGLITQAGSGAAHGMGTPLGARFQTPHGVSGGIMLPYVMDYSLSACLERYRDIAEAMGCNVEGKSMKEAAQEAVTAVHELLKDMEFPHLRDYVNNEGDISILAREAAMDKCCQLNARIVTQEAADSLYHRAWNQE
ncbi:iron-containing alcohol dehydrogenase [Dysgonomonas capnocytophagoides]|uniref:iron-containing alcohol dehydrogenase n=1 Tax=Dysgonomonas capnocytophagoides TaxID=45254 RepID=UPI002A8095A3|nr:iron-containing alcohol dehydrogenase [Dysgonomonas capnocytophagoides]